MWQYSVTVLFFLSRWIILVPVFVGLYRGSYKRVAFNCIFFYVVLSFITEMASWWMNFHHMNNLILFHVFSVVEFFLLMEFYRQFASLNLSRAIRICQVAFAVFALLNALFYQPIDAYNTIPRGIMGILFILISLYFFFFVLAQKRLKTEKNAFIYTNSALLIYFSATFPVYALSNSILFLSDSINEILWSIKSFITVLFFFLLAIALWIQKQN